MLLGPADFRHYDMDWFFTLEISEGHLRGGPGISCFVSCLFKAVEWSLPHQLHFNDAKPHWILIVWKVNKNGKMKQPLWHITFLLYLISNIGFLCVEVLLVATGKILVAILAAKKWVQIHDFYQHWQFASGAAQHSCDTHCSPEVLSQSGSQGNEREKTNQHSCFCCWALKWGRCFHFSA